MILYITLAIICLFAGGTVFIYVLEKKIARLEAVILQSFQFRTSLIPTLFEATRNVFNKHDLVFRHILSLRVQELMYNVKLADIDELLHIEQKIHKELNFIFKVANKHPKLLKNAKFIYTRDLFVESSYHIGVYLEMYQKIISVYNRYVVLKNYTIIGLLLPMKQKTNI